MIDAISPCRRCHKWSHALNVEQETHNGWTVGSMVVTVLADAREESWRSCHG